jgi:hypothetical protein
MLVRQIAGLLVIAGAGFGATSVIDPNLLNLAMPDAKVLAGVNATTAKTSPLGQFLISQLQGSIPQLQGAIAVTGFNPFTDVTQVLMAGGADPAKPGWLLLSSGDSGSGRAEPERADLCRRYTHHFHGSERKALAGGGVHRYRRCGSG